MSLRAMVGGAARERALHRLGGFRYLRRAKVGARPKVWGKPAVEAAHLEIGDDFILHSRYATTRIAGRGHVRIGNGVFMNHGSSIVCRTSVTIGNDVALSQGVAIMDSHGHGIEGGAIEGKPVVIEDGAWIGHRAIILPGVTVGARAIVGAGAVVAKDVAPETVVAGAPARVIRSLNYPPDVARAWHGGAQ